MPLDAYQLCPGGTNQKIKFCACGKDLLGELNHVLDKVGAGQRIAALTQINQLLKTHPARACLLAIKGVIQLQTSNPEGVKETAAEFRQHYPENPIALAFSAIDAAIDTKFDQAVEELQHSLEQSDGALHETTYTALGIVAQTLLYSDNLPAAMGHLLFQAQLAPESDTSAREMLVRLYGSPELSLLLKHQLHVHPDAANVQRISEAERPAHRGCWRRAVAQLEQLAEELPDEPAVLCRLARYQGFLGRIAEMAETLHRMAHLPGVALDTAVEAEATAQLLTFAERNMVDEVLHVYPISDAERVMELLLSDKQVSQLPGDQSRLAREASPPPRGVFWLLDREIPASGKYLQLDQIPNVLGEMYLYGRETDRPARVEFVAIKADDYEQARRQFEKLLGDYASPLEGEEAVQGMPAEEVAMQWRWRLPDDTSAATRASLVEEKRRDVYLNTWPNTPLEVLDGKTPTEVADDPQYRIRLLAAILLLELSLERVHSAVDLNELRAKLGLPLREPIDPASVSLDELSPLCLHLLQLDGVSDDALRRLVNWSSMFAIPRAVRRICHAMLERPGFAHPAEQAKIYRALETSCHDLEESFEFNRKGREAAVAAGGSPAPWLLNELQLRLLQRNTERFTEVLQILRARHLNEPGVAQALQTIVSQLTSAFQSQRGADAGPAGPGGGPQPGPEASAGGESSSLWTPGGSAPSTAPGEKPQLWTPGMD